MIKVLDVIKNMAGLVDWTAVIICPVVYYCAIEIELLVKFIYKTIKKHRNK